MPIKDVFHHFIGQCHKLGHIKMYNNYTIVAWWFVSMIRLLSQKDKRNLSFLIHPSAQEAFSFYQSLNHQFSFNQINSEHSQAFFCNGQTLHATRHKNTVFYLFSGFEHRIFNISQTDHSYSNILIYPSDYDAIDIEMQAWRGVLTTVFSSIRSDSLGILYHQINDQLPKRYISLLFGKNSLSEQKLAEISTTTRSTIAKQRERIQQSKKQKNEQTPQPTIFDLLTRRECDGQGRD